MMPAREKVREGLIAVLEKVLEENKNSYEINRQVVIDSPGAMQSQHDTMGKEAAWLAGGIAQRIEDIERSIYSVKMTRYPSNSGKVLMGSIVLAEDLAEGGDIYFFVAPAAGGVEVEVDGIKVKAITPKAPLCREMIGKFEGDEIELQDRGIKYKIKKLA